MKKILIALLLVLFAASAYPCGWFFNPATGLQEWTCETPCIFDPNGDGVIDFADLVYLVSYLYSGGPAPVQSGDANGDGVCDPADVIYLVNYLYYGGPAPIPSCP